LYFFCDPHQQGALRLRSRASSGGAWDPENNFCQILKITASLL
jgi:hypothetical protein